MTTSAPLPKSARGPPDTRPFALPTPRRVRGMRIGTAARYEADPIDYSGRCGAGDSGRQSHARGKYGPEHSWSPVLGQRRASAPSVSQYTGSDDAPSTRVPQSAPRFRRTPGQHVEARHESVPTGRVGRPVLVISRPTGPSTTNGSDLVTRSEPPGLTDVPRASGVARGSQPERAVPACSVSSTHPAPEPWAPSWREPSTHP